MIGMREKITTKHKISLMHYVVYENREGFWGYNFSFTEMQFKNDS